MRIGHDLPASWYIIWRNPYFIMLPEITYPFPIRNALNMHSQGSYHQLRLWKVYFWGEIQWLSLCFDIYSSWNLLMGLGITEDMNMMHFVSVSWKTHSELQAVVHKHGWLCFTSFNARGPVQTSFAIVTNFYHIQQNQLLHWTKLFHLKQRKWEKLRYHFQVKATMSETV